MIKSCRDDPWTHSFLHLHRMFPQIIWLHLIAILGKTKIGLVVWLHLFRFKRIAPIFPDLLVFVLNCIPALDCTLLVDSGQFLCLFFKACELFHVDFGYFRLRMMEDIVDNGEKFFFMLGFEFVFISWVVLSVLKGKGSFECRWIGQKWLHGLFLDLFHTFLPSQD